MRATFPSMEMVLGRWTVILACGVLMAPWVQAMGRHPEGGSAALTQTQVRAILKEAGFRPIGAHYVTDGCDDPLDVHVQARDLNGDGKPEAVLVASGSPCFSGVVQSNVSVYVRSPAGHWRDVLGFVPAFGVRTLPTRTQGYADLLVTVLAECDRVYRWSGFNYVYAKNQSTDGKPCNAPRR